jgi:putative membrane protein
MRILSLILIGAIALLHAYIAYFEMFAWESRGPEVFTSFPAELFPATVNMALNQGLYNSFLAAGLIWALTVRDPVWHRRIATCFLLFVLVAGVVGALSVSTRILFVQAVPAMVALIVLWLGARRA